LTDEMMVIKYKFSAKGSIQIESKDDMRSRGLKSPDRLDAAMYAGLDMSQLISGRYAGKNPGDIISMDSEFMNQDNAFYNKWVW